MDRRLPLVALSLGALGLPATFAVVSACSLPGGDSVGDGPVNPVAQNVPSASTSAPPLDANTNAPPQTDSGCQLAAVGIEFDDAGCHTCMQTSCCAQTATCFAGEGSTSGGASACALLYECINACPSRGLGVGGGDGGGSDAGDSSQDGGAIDAAADAGGDPCVTECEGKHPNARESARAYIQCYGTACANACR